ncbi:putative Zn(2)-C6 fungal-type domain-containing protein [Seiridium unicorne]|uniref:Zn(2)-C6 fungal-type domain-containing protein n=1 Tax=Seiridium unicorne TaxID=138068 RepID=A0ABR2V7L2_9PEZI
MGPDEDSSAAPLDIELMRQSVTDNDAGDGLDSADRCTVAVGQNGTINSAWAHSGPAAGALATATPGDCGGRYPDGNLGGLGFGSSGGMESQLLHPIHNDMWYLASLWDAGLPGPMIPTLDNGTLGDLDVNGYQQDPLFRTPNDQSSPPIPSDSQQGVAQQRQLGIPDTASDVDVHTQVIRSLDVQEHDGSAQYIGLSGDVDPCFLQHLQFSDDGVCDFGHFQYRRVAGRLPPAEHLPSSGQTFAHFVISKPKENEDNSSPSVTTSDREPVLSLNERLRPETESRLVGLFLRYVFPGLPVLSRSQLKVRTISLIPEVQFLSSMPSYLAAAVYASAVPFRRYDPILCVSQLDSAQDASALWQIAYRGIQQNMHNPCLSLIQTILIYLQKASERTFTATADLPGHWPLLGSAVNIAFQLGLHLDCQSWPIPPWERRLRRRLWWALYSEATWRSLLLGLPNAIPNDEWDVSSLEGNDFVIDHFQCPAEVVPHRDPSPQDECRFCHGGYDFRFLASLSTQASEIYRELYTLSAIKRVGNDFGAAVTVCQRLLAGIQNWKKSLPAYMVMETRPGSFGDRDYFHPGSATQIKLAILTAEVLVYKAMLRPLPSFLASRGVHRGSQRPTTSEHQADSALPPDGQAHSHNYQDQLPYNNPDTVLETFRGAIDVAQRASSFACQLSSYDRNSLFYSWTQNCFAAISNFIIILLIQAPTVDMSKEMLALLARWVVVLREQCILFGQMQLGLIHLDSIFRLGMEKALRLPPHVKAAVEAELPTRRLYKE